MVLRMKNLLVLLALTGFFACSSPQESADCIETDYGIDFTAEAENIYCFSDDLMIEIVSLENALCPCNVLCDWDGEIIVHMNIIRGDQIKEYDYHSVLQDANVPIDLALSFKGYELVSDCTDDNPSTEVAHVILRVG